MWVVYVSVPTSNHNLDGNNDKVDVLYMSLFLHQTTTIGAPWLHSIRLYMSLFLHQTTTTAPS